MFVLFVCFNILIHYEQFSVLCFRSMLVNHLVLGIQRHFMVNSKSIIGKILVLNAQAFLSIVNMPLYIEEDLIPHMEEYFKTYLLRCYFSKIHYFGN